MWTFTSTLLDSLYSSLCMLMYESCLRPCSGYSQSLSFVCACFIRYESSIALTHRVTFIVAQASSRSVNDQSWVSHLSITPSVNLVEHVCLDGLVVLLSSHASVCSYDHLCIFRLFTHLAIFSEGSDDLTPLWKSDHHPAIDPIDSQLEKCRSTNLVFSSCDACKKFNQLSCWPPGY